MSLSTAAGRRPVTTALSCIASQFVLTVLILELGRALLPDAYGKVKRVAFASTILLPLLFVHALGLWRRVGFERFAPSAIFWVSLVSGAIWLSLGVRATDGSFAGESAMQFANAFGEVLLFRGVVFALQLGLPRWRSIVLSGVTFGCMHVIHGFMDGNWSAAVTSIAGIMLASVRDETGSLWLVIALHMLLNLCKLHSNVEAVAGPSVVFFVERLENVFELLLAAHVIATGARHNALRSEAAADS
jgi:membrane protease YdiL (CAAX protease family)